MIEINNLTTGSIDEDFLKKIAQTVLTGEKIQGKVELSIALIGPGRMRKLNQRYRGKNRVTDVLSFPEAKVFFDRFKIRGWQKEKGLGEIVICPCEVKKSSRIQNSTFEKELALVLIHGILHLLGYDDKREEGMRKMEKKQKEYVSKVQLTES